jgi:lipopolysaccharide export system protein LptC
MSAEATEIRERRKAFAKPDGSHDRLVSWLGKLLPAGVGVVVALMVVSPFSQRGEVSFLLDRNKVAIAEDRLRVDNAMYRGQDSHGRPFSITAGEAVQRSASDTIVHMHDMVARILLDDGPAMLSAESGSYDFDAEKVAIDGSVRFQAADGYRMVARDVSVYLDDKTMIGEGAVDGAIPAGTFSADRIVANLQDRTITLEGHARLRMAPGELRKP